MCDEQPGLGAAERAARAGAEVGILERVGTPAGGTFSSPWPVELKARQFQKRGDGDSCQSRSVCKAPQDRLPHPPIISLIILKDQFKVPI